MNHARNLGQEQAQRAWDWVQAARKLGGKDSDRYGTLARKLPSYLQVSGLGQTLAFLHSSARKGDKLLLQQLGEHLAEHVGHNQRHAVKLILVLDPDQYRAATREAMAMADWLKRFAQGELGEEES